ncbi:MAG: CPBP family intramembrane metalloprotease [Planctomycetes bacterium]|nr:CPBP family intramembrane metalloprotease [Planctomycetota bacterium]
MVADDAARELDTSKLATRFYALLVLACGGVLLLQHGAAGVLERLLDDRSLRTDLILGLGLGLSLTVASRVLVRVVPAMNRLELELAEAIGPLSAATASKLAIASGVAEELLFRGVLQPALGPTAATLLFAAAHLGPSARFGAWALWAGVAGAAFAFATAHTENLLAAIVAHVTVNYMGLSWLAARGELRTPGSPDSRGKSAPRRG